ncbi:MAG: type II toxin-antitoxin system VapC family toxin [Candidatus Verstraetearchaeota archaeon]|jgi:predicted nucleic acid-binding protein|nr:type II toxin-antitoxin system VapC family toxin [Candidatus Verstraetearchaeota archaeon]
MIKSMYLFDSSSIIKAFKEIKLKPLGGQAIQYLTIYEVLNAIWKEFTLLHLLTVDEVLSLVNSFLDLIHEMIILDIKGLEHDIIQLAISRKMTVYDASYIALAIKYKLILVTEDKELMKKSRDLIQVISLNDIIH